MKQHPSDGHLGPLIATTNPSLLFSPFTVRLCIQGHCIDSGVMKIHRLHLALTYNRRDPMKQIGSLANRDMACLHLFTLSGLCLAFCPFYTDSHAERLGWYLYEPCEYRYDGWIAFTLHRDPITMLPLDQDTLIG